MNYTQLKKQNLRIFLVFGVITGSFNESNGYFL